MRCTGPVHLHLLQCPGLQSTAVRIRVQTVLCQYSKRHGVPLYGTVRSYEVEQYLYGFGPYFCTYFNVQGCTHSGEEQSTNRQMKGRYMWLKWIGISSSISVLSFLYGYGTQHMHLRLYRSWTWSTNNSVLAFAFYMDTTCCMHGLVANHVSTT